MLLSHRKDSTSWFPSLTSFPVVVWHKLTCIFIALKPTKDQRVIRQKVHTWSIYTKAQLHEASVNSCFL